MAEHLPDRPSTEGEGFDTDARASELREAWATVLPHIERLRTLDLGGHHPAVVFRPRPTANDEALGLPPA